jgi:hypothetical protein
MSTQIRRTDHSINDNGACPTEKSTWRIGITPRKNMHTFLAWLSVLAVMLVTGGGPIRAEAQPGVASPNDTARFLAGLQPAVGSPLEALTKEPVWQQYARHFDAEWAALEAKQISKVRAWGEQHVGKPKPTLFYMFSGPDFLYASTLFPTASTYVMSGLEPVGRLPDILALRKNTLPTVLGQLRASLSDILSRSFFITSHMDQKLRQAQLSGVLPVLYVFLARTDRTITDVTYLTLEPDGRVKPFEPAANAGSPKAVRISFTDKTGRAQKLYFFSTNLANKGVAQSGFLEFCKSLGKGDALIKSASYLPHGGEFSTVRDFLLSNATRIVQDDTGIPIRLLGEADWKVQPFGVYTRPIPPFTHAYQPAMRTLYDKHKPVRLEFSYGYRWRQNQSNVQIITRSGT